MDADGEQPLYTGIDRWENEGDVTAADFELMLEVDIALIDWLNKQDRRDIT